MLDDEAKERMAMHADHATTRRLSPNYENIGLIGEAQFACDFKLPLDLKRRPGGDSGVDFIVPIRFSVNVKTYCKPIHLIEEQGKVCADIYVLAAYFDDPRHAEMLGWEWGAVLSRAPVRDFGHGIINHYIRREALRDMADLHKRVMRLA